MPFQTVSLEFQYVTSELCGFFSRSCRGYHNHVQQVPQDCDLRLFLLVQHVAVDIEANGRRKLEVAGKGAFHV